MTQCSYHPRSNYTRTLHPSGAAAVTAPAELFAQSTACVRDAGTASDTLPFACNCALSPSYWIGFYGLARLATLESAEARSMSTGWRGHRRPRTHEHHGRALRRHEREHQVAHLAPPQCQHACVPRLALLHACMQGVARLRWIRKGHSGPPAGARIYPHSR